MIKIKEAAWIATLLLLILTGCSQANSDVQPETSESDIVLDDTINIDALVLKTIYGNWLVSEYVGSAQLLDLNPLPENYNNHMEENTTDFINSNILFNQDTVINYSPPTEIGFVYENEYDLFGGYKVPIEFEMPVVYVCIDHIDFDNSINFIQDGANNTYLEINYHYYKLTNTPNSIVLGNVENIMEDIDARVLWIKEYLDTFTCVQGELYEDYYDGNDLVYRSFYQLLDSQSLSSFDDSDEYILYFDQSGNLIYSDIAHYRGPMYSIYFHENMLLHTEVGPFYTGGTFASGSLTDVENAIKEDAYFNFILEDIEICLKNEHSAQYNKCFNVEATEQMPEFSFELTGKREEDEYYNNIYYPLKLVIKTKETIIQEINFSEDDFAPCTLDTFDFDYGNFKFDGYGGFKMLSTSMGKNPSYYFWIWDKNKNCFVKYPELEMSGYITFDYDNQLINVSSTGSAVYHEFTTYKYINDKLTLIEKVIDADGFRKVYKLIKGELQLIETSEQLKDEYDFWGVWRIDEVVLTSELYTGTTKDGELEENLYNPEDFIGMEVE